MLSPGGTFKSHQAEIEAGVFLLTHADAVLHVLTVKHAIINRFFYLPMTMKWLDDIKRKSWILKLEPGGFISLQRAFPRSKMEQEVKDHRAAGWNTG